MPSVEHTHVVQAPAGTLWGYVEDLSNWAADIPGYLSHEEVTADESLWTVQGDVGMLSRRVQFRVRVTDRIPSRLVAFSLEGLNEAVTGAGIFRTRSADDEPRSSALDVRPSETRRSFWRHWLTRVMRRLFGGMLRADDRPGAPSAQIQQPAVTGIGTEFSLALTIEAGGLMAPVVNSLLEPLLEPAAIHLAERIAIGVEQLDQSSERTTLGEQAD